MQHSSRLSRAERAALYRLVTYGPTIETLETLASASSFPEPFRRAALRSASRMRSGYLPETLDLNSSHHPSNQPERAVVIKSREYELIKGLSVADPDLLFQLSRTVGIPKDIRLLLIKAAVAALTRQGGEQA